MKKLNRRSSLRALLGGASVLIVAAATAQAQQPGPPQAPTDAGAGQANAPGLEEVVVTARKRSEKLQTLAQAVSALTKEDLLKRFDTDVTDFANVSPNVIIDNIQQGPGSPASISIRGIQVADVEKSFEPTTGVVVDGLYIGVNSGAIFKAIDISQVEILRGPQGTLFGRNSIAGVINVQRSDPTFETTGKAEVGYGNYNAFQADAVASTGITDRIAVKLNIGEEGFDGYFHNVLTGLQNGRERYFQVGTKILFNVTDALTLKYEYQFADDTSDAPTVLNLSQPDQLFCSAYHQCAQSVFPYTPQSGGRYDVTTEGNPGGAYFRTNTHIFSGRYDINDEYSLDYIFGDYNTDEQVRQDFDATSLLLYETSRPAAYEQTSHELRLAYTGDSLKYTVGLYSFQSDYTIHLDSFIGFAVPGQVLDVKQTAHQTTDSKSVFGEGDYQFLDDFTLTVGGRYTYETKTGGIEDANIHTLADPASKTWQEFTPKASIKYTFTPDLSIYFLYSRGYRSGGFNGRPSTVEAATLPYAPENVDNFDLGFKSEWLDHHLKINGDIFIEDYTNLQEEVQQPVSIGTGQQSVVANVAAANIKGVEFDASYLPAEIPGLKLEGNLGLLDAKYVNFIADLTGAGVKTDNSYLNMPRAPHITSSILLSYEWDMMNGTAWVDGDWHFIGREDVDFFNFAPTKNAAQNIVDASVNYRYGSTTFSLYGKNILGNDAYTIAFDVAGRPGGLWTYAAPRPPATFGFRIQYIY
ncbi:MAG: TonB-dependent receptor [Candidatus Pacebacteria bacterium]|nr:TonB-dependent receptor [Candidatus Paceibacterota bacterium]